MEIRASVRPDRSDAWIGEARLPIRGSDAIRVSGPSRDRCVAALRRSIGRALAARGRAGPVVLLIESSPVLAGVAEAAEVMGWDKRRVITYIDRGRFPEPIQTLASGRVWVRSDVEQYRDAWRARQRRRPG